MDEMTLRTPFYLLDEKRLEANLRILRETADECGAKILLAQKAFSMFAVYPLIARYLHGSAASGLYEARLGHEHLGGETHVFSAAYRDDEFDDIAAICDHIVFNSLAQLHRFRGRARGKSLGLRINPEHSTQKNAIYDPCSPFSRLGVRAKELLGADISGIFGLHFHTLCEQNADALEETLDAVIDKFGAVLDRMEWINLGGGHHITRADYDIPRLVSCVKRLRDKYGLRVYLEPGEAVALNSGELVCTVIDVVHNEMDIAIVDASAACHMPDVIEMPYRPPLLNAGVPDEKQHTFRIAGPTCLAGDIIGDYSFEYPLVPGDKLRFQDMAIYTMVKNNTFNGMRLPDIVLKTADGELRMIKSFGYEDFKSRLS